MVSEQDALETVLAAARPMPEQETPLPEALDRFLAREIFARRAHPAFANSVVDGYAVRSADGLMPRRLCGEQPAGVDRGLVVNEGEAARIFTGAPIPAGADAVVMQEEVRREGEVVTLTETVETGQNIRRPGADVAAGQLLARAGQRVTPQLMGLLAGQGMDRVAVRGCPRVAIISNGDELKPPGAEIRPGEMFEANSFLLAALLRRLGLQTSLATVPDDPAAIEKVIAEALAASEVLILSGGVSVGDRDFVRPALAKLGIHPVLWGVRMKPGKPLAFAAHDGRLIFGLPGNPVSAFVTFLIFTRPVLLKMMGATGGDLFLERRPVTLQDDLQNPGDRPHYLRGQIRDGTFQVTGLQESHALLGLARSDALLRLEAGEKRMRGEPATALTW